MQDATIEAAGLLGADLLGDVSDEQLPGLVRDVVVGMFA